MTTALDAATAVATELRARGAPDTTGGLEFPCPTCRAIAVYRESTRRWVCLGMCRSSGNAADLAALLGLIANEPRARSSAPPDAPTTGDPTAPSIMTADALLRTCFPEPQWAIPGVLPQGASLLAGRPKLGKSWLALEVSVAIAAGGMAIGKVPVVAGDVLFLGLEDTFARLQERLLRMLGDEPAPERLHLACEWPRLDDGGIEALDAWLTQHPTARLVVVDALTRLRPRAASVSTLYEQDYRVLADLKAVADAHRVALVAIHHTRKLTADDPLDMISGTNGLAGAADASLILKREAGRADAVLYVRGRDLPEAELALSFEPASCTWHLLGEAAEFRLSAGRAEIVAVLRERGPVGPKAVAEALGSDPGNVRVTLHRMKNAGQLLATGGVYRLPEH